jgi:hypothetical protein
MECGVYWAILVGDDALMTMRTLALVVVKVCPAACVVGQAVVPKPDVLVERKMQGVKEVVLQRYAAGEMPLLVQTETSGVMLAVDAKGRASQ